jgi:hypothetical protein
LDSPLLRLVKERNEAREMVKRLLYTAHLATGEEEYFKATSQDKYDALADAQKAVFKAFRGKERRCAGSERPRLRRPVRR